MAVSAIVASYVCVCVYESVLYEYELMHTEAAEESSMR